MSEFVDKNAPLSEGELAKLEALERAAFPTPWCEDWCSGAARHICRNVDYDAFTMSQGNGWSRYDGTLIAAARNALPALLAEVRAGRAAAKDPYGWSYEPAGSKARDLFDTEELAREHARPGRVTFPLYRAQPALEAAERERDELRNGPNLIHKTQVAAAKEVLGCDEGESLRNGIDRVTAERDALRERLELMWKWIRSWELRGILPGSECVRLANAIRGDNRAVDAGEEKPNNG